MRLRDLAVREVVVLVMWIGRVYRFDRRAVGNNRRMDRSNIPFHCFRNGVVGGGRDFELTIGGILWAMQRKMVEGSKMGQQTQRE